MFRQLVRLVQGRAARQLHSSCRHLGGGISALDIPAARCPAISSFCINEAARKSFACFEMEGRSFATRATNDLVRVLNAEVSHEEKTYEVSEEVQNGPPSDWSLELRPGAAEIYLRRSFKEEDILVVVAQHDPLEEEEEETDDTDEVDPLPAMPISATISITKLADKPPLEFVARVEDNFEIESVRYDVFGSEDHMPYEPVFSDLDEGVANAFRDYLEERGINDELAKYIQACMTDKEQKEYELWMTNISKFLAN